jgi:uncharacterized membrane protein YeaQ/YmgE (transglycosylase-associated protein family)
MLERSMLGWILVGLIVGLGAKLVARDREPGGLIVSVMIAIAGALLAGFSAQAAGLRVGQGELAVAALGAIALLLVYRVTIRRRSS